jgi:hypothetical protein
MGPPPPDVELTDEQRKFLELVEKARKPKAR